MELQVATSVREELVDITMRVREAVAASGIAEGVAVVFCPHTTAAVTINENADPDVRTDLVAGLARVAPRECGWRHREGNSDGHLKTALVGPSLSIPVAAGHLLLGTWQGIYLCEFDGPRTRSVHVAVVSGRC